MEKRSTYFLGFIIFALALVIFAGIYFKTGRLVYAPLELSLPLLTAFCLYKTIFPGRPRNQE